MTTEYLKWIADCKAALRRQALQEVGMQDARTYMAKAQAIAALKKAWVFTDWALDHSAYPDDWSAQMYTWRNNMSDIIDALEK